MRLIIDIPEDIKVAISRVGLLRIPDDMIKIVDGAIQSGKPLPKGHGRLIEADEIKKAYPIMYNDFGMEINRGVHITVDSAPTIILADKEEENAVSN